MTYIRYIWSLVTTRRDDWNCSCEIMLNAEALKRPSLSLSGISKSSSTKCHRVINHYKWIIRVAFVEM